MFKKLWSLFAGSETRESTVPTWRTECLELDPPPAGASKPVEPTTLPPIIRREPVDVALAEAQVGIKQFLARIDDAITRRDIVLTPDERTDGKLFSGVFEGHAISIRAPLAWAGNPFSLGVRVAIDDVDIPSEIAGAFEDKIQKSLKANFSDTKALADAERLRDLGKLLQQTPPSKTIS